MKIYFLAAFLIFNLNCANFLQSSEAILSKPQNKTYYSRKNSKNVLILREDKSCYIQHENFFFKSYSCTYRIDGGMVEIKYQDGTANIGKIGENKIDFGDEIFSDQPPATPKRF